jgi:hypothetical protein
MKYLDDQFAEDGSEKKKSNAAEKFATTSLYRQDSKLVA